MSDNTMQHIATADEREAKRFKVGDNSSTTAMALDPMIWPPEEANARAKGMTIKPHWMDDAAWRAHCQAKVSADQR